MKQREYHISKVDVILPHWPNGGWAVYRITGDKIADRIVHKAVNTTGSAFGGPFYKGPVIARHSWCGYLGMTETWEGVTKLVEDDAKNA